MNTNTDPVRALIAELRDGCVYHRKRWSGDTHADLGTYIDEGATDALMAKAADELESALASAPPSAPVGVEVLRELREPYACMAGSHVGDAAGRDFQRIVDGLDAAISALSQQPAAVSALEVFRIAGGDTECEPNPTPERALEVLRDLRACYDEALTQQPAAPSGEAVGEYVRATVTALERIGEDQAVVAGVDTSALADKGRSLLAAPQQPAGVDEALAGWSLRHEDRMIYLIGPDGRSYACVDSDFDAQQQGGSDNG